MVAELLSARRTLVEAWRTRLGAAWHARERLAERWQHSRRRRLVVAQVISSRPRRLLVVCHGNVCRSPFAAAVLARAIGDGPATVQSAGRAGYEAPAPAPAREAARRRGISLDGHLSRGVTAATLEGSDLVIAMEPAQGLWLHARLGVPWTRIVLLGDLDPEPIVMRSIADPIGGSPAVYDACYARIERCATVLGRAVLASLSSERRA